MGSIAFSGMARSELLLGRDPDDPRERVLFLIKCAESEAQAISYRCDGSFEWCGVSDLTPGDLNRKEKGSEDKSDSKKEITAQWLKEALQNGPMRQTIIQKMAGANIPPFKRYAMEKANRDSWNKVLFY
jgi:hypothetical protein